MAIARLRVAASYLHVNRRLINPNACIKCPFYSQAETELHFLTECIFYRELREKYISKHFTDTTSVTLNQLIANESMLVTSDVAMYINYGLKVRAERLRIMKLRRNIVQIINRD